MFKRSQVKGGHFDAPLAVHNGVRQANPIVHHVGLLRLMLNPRSQKDQKMIRLKFQSTSKGATWLHSWSPKTRHKPTPLWQNSRCEVDFCLARCDQWHVETSSVYTTKVPTAISGHHVENGGAHLPS